jgi:hypothetical protein
MSLPIVPPAPGRLSITNCWPIARVNPWPCARARISVVPPAENATMTRTGLTGYGVPWNVVVDCAEAAAQASAHAAAANDIAIRVIVVSNIV